MPLIPSIHGSLCQMVPQNNEQDIKDIDDFWKYFINSQIDGYEKYPEYMNYLNNIDISELI